MMPPWIYRHYFAKFPLNQICKSCVGHVDKENLQTQCLKDFPCSPDEEQEHDEWEPEIAIHLPVCRALHRNHFLYVPIPPTLTPRRNSRLGIFPRPFQLDLQAEFEVDENKRLLSVHRGKYHLLYRVL
ncbi:hypothetical protein TNCV_4506591 [Trichonephila clavipes]|nr:hypothetical protein TNCV_4506591 [Trichonephila clavipes]